LGIRGHIGLFRNQAAKLGLGGGRWQAFRQGEQMNWKHVLLGAIVLAVCILGGLWLFLRQVPPNESLSAFQQACIDGQRRGISGDTSPLDDQSEARMLAFCDCVAAQVDSRLSQQEIAAIGLDQQSQALNAKLESIFALCRLRSP
jgi:hypothetical protein